MVVTIRRLLRNWKTAKLVVGKWNLEVTKETVKELEVTYNAPAAQNLVPQKDDSFVQFGNFSDIKKIIKSGIFYPSFITGFRATANVLCRASVCPNGS